MKVMLTFSATLMGLLLNVTPLQKLSARLATVPSHETRMLSPCTWWNRIGGKLFVPALPPDLGAGIIQHKINLLYPLSFSCYEIQWTMTLLRI
jgi:hypothetical protein